MSDKRITVRRDGEERVIEAPVGAGFLSLLKMHGFPLVCCNGKGTCGGAGFCSRDRGRRCL